MTLKINHKYAICLHMMDCFKATLVSLPRKSNAYYEWQRDDGSRFANREQDINSWFKLKEIKEL